MEREKIEEEMEREIRKKGKRKKIYVKVNKGMEKKKEGIKKKEEVELVESWRKEKGIVIEGIMWIKKDGENKGKNFEIMEKIEREENVEKI